MIPSPTGKARAETRLAQRAATAMIEPKFFMMKL